MKPNQLVPLAMMLDHADINQSTMMGFINSQIWYTIDITSFSYGVEGILSALSKRGPKQIFVSDTSIKVINYQKYGGQAMTHMYIYKNTPIICTRKCDKENGSYVTMMTLNTKRSRKHLHEFIEKLNNVKHKYTSNLFEGQLDYVDFGGRTGRYIDVDYKTFDDVFLPDEQQYQITNGIETFVKNIPWLEEHHIPSHYGILLYGTPGCGRTSIIKALIHKYNVIPHYIQDLEDLPQLVLEQLPKQKTPINVIHMVICEDVDCTLFNRQKGFKESEDTNDEDNAFPRFKPKRTSLSSVLNSIDGIVNPHNTIFVFTTNHIEELDPALIRPGRMDLRLEIKPCCSETLNKFTKKFFNREIPSGFKCKPDVLFSTLQTKILEGYTFEDILNFMKEE